MNKKIPMRQCVGCGSMRSKKEMMRVLKTAEEEIILDTTGKKNGRGAYLCKTMDCLKMARKNRGLERSLKISIPNDVYDNLERLIQNRILSLLGLATRSRKVDSGEFMTEKAVKSGKAYLVIVALDASDNTKKEFINMCKFYHVPVCCYGTKVELGHAMGKEMRASLAITDEGFSKSLIKLLNDGGSEIDG